MPSEVDFERSLAFCYPEIAAEWHPSLNGDLTPRDVTAGKGKIKFWWLGAECGHEWDAIIKNRTKLNSRCPYCASRKVLAGFNDLGTKHPEIAAEWHPSLNGDLKPNEIMPAYNQGCWWLGEACGHTWDMPPKSRTHSRKPQGCPYCAGKRVLIGFNDLATTHPEVAAEWHPIKNKESGDTIHNVSAGSGANAWWQCSQHDEHTWSALVSSRALNGRGCPYCSGNKVLRGYSDLAHIAPKVSAEWHPIKNGSLKPDDVAPQTHEKVWWIGKACGHEWFMSPNERVGRGTGCPYCANRLTISGINDLFTLNPKVAAEWHPTLNGDLTASEVNVNSTQSVWWICTKSHVWKTVVSYRTKNLSKCPDCVARTFVSRGEQALANVVKALVGDNVTVNTSVRRIVSTELDIYIPSKRFAIEFNGVYWHSDARSPERAQNRHAYKTIECAEKGIQLVHVWEDDWRDRRDIVVRALAHRLNATERLNEPGVLLTPDESLTRRYGARTLTPGAITYQESAEFLESNHIRGKVNGTLHVGLRDKDDVLRAVFVTKRSGNKNHEGKWTIERYATRGIVPGGFTKLMKFTEAQIRERELGEITTWVTFSDSALSDGGLYADCGFTKDGVIPPDYMYVVGRATRFHKFNYRLKRFREDPALQYVEELTERELAALNGLYRIWDSGKVQWVRSI